MAIIELNSVNKIYRTDEIETLALENVNIAIEKGEFVSVMGPSGCGKSTLLNIVGLLDTPTSGTVSIDGTTLRKMSDNYNRKNEKELFGKTKCSFLEKRNV